MRPQVPNNPMTDRKGRPYRRMPRMSPKYSVLGDRLVGSHAKMFFA